MMSGSTSVSGQSKETIKGCDTSCKVPDSTGAPCCETESLGILEQFQRVYAERLKRLDGDGELAMHTLKSWVHDLTEQNTMLVHTVEELERELLKRVDLMHDQLRKTDIVIKRKEQLAKREKSEVEVNLRQQVQLLQNDVSSLLDIINQAKQQGYWSVDNVKLHTVSKNQLIGTSAKRSVQPLCQSGASVDNTQKNVREDVDSLKAQLVDKDSEINSLLERVEEMQSVFALTSKQVRDAIEAENKQMENQATFYSTVSSGLENPFSGKDDKSSETGSQVDVSPWVQERLKQQQEQMTQFISRIRELETNCNIVKNQRDQLACELKTLEDTETSLSQTVHPSMIILSRELDTTRQQLAEAIEQVQLLASVVKDLETKNNETKTALTVEVAEKHDQIVEIRREVHQLEEQVKYANMQTHFKDSIIREMRNELKVARNKILTESGSDFDSKPRRKAFPAIPEASSVSDSGLDDGELSSSSHYIQGEVDLLRSQLKEQSRQISEKNEEICAQKQKVLELEKELAELQKAPSKAVAPPQLPSITLRELEEYRLCTVEGQAAVEELRDEIEAIISDLKSQEDKLTDVEKSAHSSYGIMQNAQEKVSQALNDPTALITIFNALEDTKESMSDLQQKTRDFMKERRAGGQRHVTRERKVNKLQEQLDASHDNMRDAIETMEQALAERYEADRLSQREFSDGSSYHSCRDSDSSSCMKQVERLEENNAELLSSLTAMERLKREAESKATQYYREIEGMKDQIARRSFTEEMLHTKDQTIRELQGALESTRRQMRDLQYEFERATRERDDIKKVFEQNTNSGPLQVAELQSELARLRNQLSSLNSKQTVIEQYERRLRDSSDQAERLSSQVNSLTLNLQAKEKMLSNKEEMVNILQDTLDRTQEEMKSLKDKSVSKSSFALPWKNGKKKMQGSASSSTGTADQDEASGTNGGVSDEVSGSSGVWGWARNTATRKHRVHDV